EIDPDIKINQHINVAHTATLDIEDRRPQNPLGTRGGVYATTSFIYPSQPLEQGLRPAAIHALQQLGLTTEGLSPKPIGINLYIDELSYLAESSSLTVTVTLNCRISAEINKADRSHQGNFKSSKTYSYVKSPNEEENRKIINEILSETMTRVFNDEKLISFIQN
ncbi:MAG: YajG family lipoprotein, partial [Motiliproteus sp.]